MIEKGYIHFLKAGHGDAFILHCRKGDKYGIVVVDGGHATNPKLNQFISEIEKVGKIDLMVLTHPDDDHLVGIKKFFETHMNDADLPVDEIWANCAANLKINISPDASPAGAKMLSDILDGLQSDSKIKWLNNVTVLHEANLDYADITVISPSSEILGKFIERYRENINYKQEEGCDASASENDDFEITMSELAKRGKREPDLETYKDASNASSISFILRCDDYSILMEGDSFPYSLIDGLKEMGYSAENKLKVDFVKVAHHGSASNISNELLDMLDCDSFIISTNGHKYNHPDREAIANILCHPSRNMERTIHLYFNHPLEKLESPKPHIFNKELDADLNFETHTASDPCDSQIRID